MLFVDIRKKMGDFQLEVRFGRLRLREVRDAEMHSRNSDAG